MFGFDDAREQRDEVYNGNHQSHLSHEVVAGGAAFEAMKLFEDRQRRKGMSAMHRETVNHGFAKELLMGFAGAEVDKLVETKGLDYIDREKTKRHAERQAEHLYDQQYSGMDQYDPDARQRHQTMDY